MSHHEGYERAIAVVRSCGTSAGFVASPTSLTNYNRVWSRDGAIISLAALMTGEDDLIECARRTFHTLAEHQGPHGEIPSNVDVGTQRVSYGGTAGRVDASLWFIIGCGEYWQATGDHDFIVSMLPALERARFLLGAWEFNTRGLLYIPLTGDWSDEYLQHGYVLYDQVLYFQALTSLGAVHRHVHESEDHALIEKIGRLRHLIRANYWFESDAEATEDTYHEAMFRKGREAATKRDGRYWMPYFAPAGYGYRFDGFANVLVSLVGIADEEMADAVDEYLDGLLDPDLPVMPAFHPAIDPVDEDWEDLQMTFSYEFRNRPYEYHNGGLWPMISGFHVASLAARGKEDRGSAILDGIHNANALPVGDEASWGFPEYVHGRTHVGGGTPLQGWSASAAVMGKHALDGESVFRINSTT